MLDVRQGLVLRAGVPCRLLGDRPEEAWAEVWQAQVWPEIRQAQGRQEVRAVQGRKEARTAQ